MADSFLSPAGGARGLTIRLGIALLLPFAPLPFALSVAADQAQPEPLSPAEGSVELERTVVAAAGEHSSAVTVPSFGRYALWVESERGVGLQLVDRMAGPGSWAGEAGAADGRVDAYLDRGDYLLRTRGAPRAEGEASLHVEKFREVHPEPVRLVPSRLISAPLGDLEMRSWWLKIKGGDQRVVLEAAGRHLADLRLWRDGGWLVGDEPTEQIIEPSPGRPLRLLRLASKLPAGLYKLSAYGGPSLDWTDDDGSRPFHLRSGVPKAAEAARRRLEVSPFGFDRWRVPGGASFFRLESGADGPAGESVSIEVAWWHEDDPFATGGQSAQIVKQNRLPVAELTTGSDDDGTHVVTVRGQAGESLVLQHFRSTRVYRFRRSGPHFLSTVHAGSPGDAIESTAILSRNEKASGPKRSLEARAVELRRGVEWRSRFNLPERASLFLQVFDAGSYELRGGGDATVRLRLEPFFTSPPRDYEPPEFRDDGDRWQMDPGFYRLTLEPRRAGILTLAIRDASPATAVPPGPAPVSRSTAVFGTVELDRSDSYTLYLNQRPGVQEGVVLRALPLDLEYSLPLVADDVTPLVLPCTARRPGTVRATAEDGTSLEVSVDGGPWASSARLENRGAFELRVRPPAGLELPAAYDLKLQADALLPAAPLPVMPPDEMKLPDFPVLEASAPRRFDLGRQSRETFLVRADQAALYRLESTGLLDTAGVVRTRVVPRLEQRQAGGSGRNFAIQRYLGPGDYQLTVSTRQRSTGRLGVQLVKAPVADGGELRLGVPARGWVDAGSAVGYRFRIAEAGEFRLRSLGLSSPFRIRLEDAEGWPLIRPGAAGDVEISLEAGDYRWIVLPQEVRARQVTLIERVPEEQPRQGHGPFPLPLEKWVSHRWLEPEQGGERSPDVWRFELPASADVTIRFDAEMAATIRRLDGDGGASDVAEVSPRRPWQGQLGAGVYHLLVRSARPNNRLDYRLRLSVRQLLAGRRVATSAPASFEVRVGEESLVELWSFGSTDVRARLYGLDGAGPGGRGELLASGDDRPGDWNFRLARRLDAGAYRLELEPVGVGGRTEIIMGLPTEQVAAPWRLAAEAARRSVSPGDGAVRVPLEVPAGSDLVVVGFESAENVRLTFELDGEPVSAREGRSGSLWLPLPVPPRSLHLRLDSLDQSGNETRLEAASVVARRVSEKAAADGLRPRKTAAMGGRGVLAVEVEGLGCFRMSGEGVEVSARRGRGPSLAGAAVSATEDLLWLAAPAGRQLGLRRHLVRPGAPSTRLRIPPAGEAVCNVVGGPAVVRADGVGAPVSLSIDGSFADQAVSERSAVAVVSAAGLLHLRAGDGGAGGTGEAAGLEVDVVALGIAEPAPVAASWGRQEWSLAPASAARLALPATELTTRMRLTLSRGLVAAAGGRVFWADEEGTETLVDGSFESLVVLNPGALGGHAAVDLTPISASPSAVVRAAPFERRMARRGALELAVPESGGFLHVLGGRPVLQGADGSLSRQLVTAVPAGGGRLLLRHDAGLVMAWISRSGQPGDGLAFSARAAPLELPATVVLEGRSRAFELELDRPAVLSLRAPVAAVSAVERPGEPVVTAVHPGALSLDLMLPAGRSTVGLRGVAGEDLAGALEARLQSVAVIGEGIAEEVLLGPGEARFFALELEADGEIGLGVRADSDVVGARLLDSSGRLIGEGVVQWHELVAGRYLLALELDAGQSPVRARPAVVGLEPPGTGPPREILESYLRLAPPEQEAP